jgi:Rrf2 family protein
VRVSAKADYAVRAAIEIAASEAYPVKTEQIADKQAIPLTFLHKIMNELRMAKLVTSTRGPDGGHALARPADEISIADILRAVEGPLAEVRNRPPESVEYAGSALPLQQVWIALRTNLRDVLESVTLLDVAAGRLPDHIVELTGLDDSWLSR